MGWGLDLVWPVTVERAGLRMGIVDAVPVRHSLRRPAQHYRHGHAQAEMHAYLERREHLRIEQASVILDSYVS